MSNNNLLTALKQQYARAVYDSEALLIRREPFQLRSGKNSHLYINHREFLSSSGHIQLMAQLYQELIRQHVGACTVAAVESVMSPILCGAVTVYGGQNVVSVRSKKLEHGTQEQIYGAVSGRVAVVDDMTSTGGTILQATEVLRNEGHEVTHAVVSVVRDPSLAETFAASGLQLLYVATLAELAAGVPDLSEEERFWLREEQERNDQ